MKLRVILGICVLLSGLVIGPATAHEDGSPSIDGEEIQVLIGANGDVRVIETEVYDLTDDHEASEFQKLADSDSAKREALSRFENRTTDSATTMAETTNRDVTTSQYAIRTQQPNDQQGVVTYTTTFENLASIDSGEITLPSVFVSSYDTSGKTLTVIPPQSYQIDSASPEPDTQTKNVVQWEDSSNLEDFSVVLEQPPEPTETTEQPTTTETPQTNNTPMLDALLSPLVIGIGFSLIIVLVLGILWTRRV